MTFFNNLYDYGCKAYDAAQNAYNHFSPYFVGNPQNAAPANGQADQANEEQQKQQPHEAPRAPNIFAPQGVAPKKKSEEDLKLDDLNKQKKKLENDIKKLAEDAGIDEDSDEEDDILPPQNPNPAPQNAQDVPEWTPYKKLEMPAGTPKSRELLIALDWLRRDFEHTFEKKLAKQMQNLKELDIKQKLMNDLLQKVVELSEAQKNSQNGGFDCTNDVEMKILLENAKNAGIVVPENKTVFSKAEKDLLVRNIERFGRELEKKIKEEAQAIEETKTMRNQVFEMIKALQDRLSAIIKKMAEAIAGR